MHSPCSQHRRIVLLTDGHSTPFLAKTAISLLRYRTADIVAVLDRQAAGQTADQLLRAGGEIPVVDSLQSVPEFDAIYVGIAPPGGKMPPQWRSVLMEAIDRRAAVVSGLHDFITDDPELVGRAERAGSALIDIRKNSLKTIASGQAFRPECLRIQSVGQDCTIGKMVCTLELQRGLAAAGYDAAFLATGQTGIMISGRGVPVDCVVSDFVNGAVEQLVAAHQQHDFLLIEGQGSIAHPAYSAVTLGLMHGAAPQGLVYCYEAGRTMVKGFSDYPIVDHAVQIQAYRVAASLRHPCDIIGVAVNTRNLAPAAARAEVDWAEQQFGLPACDVYRDGADKLVQACVQLRQHWVTT